MVGAWTVRIIFVGPANTETGSNRGRGNLVSQRSAKQSQTAPQLEQAATGDGRREKREEGGGKSGAEKRRGRRRASRLCMCGGRRAVLRRRPVWPGGQRDEKEHAPPPVGALGEGRRVPPASRRGEGLSLCASAVPSPPVGRGHCVSPLPTAHRYTQYFSAPSLTRPKKETKRI